MRTSGSGAPTGFRPHRLAGGAVAAALALAPHLACADETGESFWTPGSFGSLAATPSQPGFSLSSTWYRTSTTAGSEVARARAIRIGRLDATVAESVSAISVSPEDLAMITPSYTFATPFSAARPPSGCRRSTAASERPTMRCSTSRCWSDRSRPPDPGSTRSATR